jgi:hypothetical protein
MAVLLAVVSLPLIVTADVAGTPADEAAIRKFIDADPLAEGAAKAKPAPPRTAEHADFVNVFGGWTQGAAEFYRPMNRKASRTFKPRPESTPLRAFGSSGRTLPS